jgi:hypothetical protein
MHRENTVSYQARKRPSGTLSRCVPVSLRNVATGCDVFDRAVTFAQFGVSRRFRFEMYAMRATPLRLGQRRPPSSGNLTISSNRRWFCIEPCGARQVFSSCEMVRHYGLAVREDAGWLEKGVEGVLQELFNAAEPRGESW